MATGKFQKGIVPWNKGKKTGISPVNKKEKVLIICKQCSESFCVQPYRKETALFCSPRCRAKSNNQKENHPCWKGGVNYNLKYRQDILSLLGLECKTCGFNDVRALQVDHIKGGGAKERKAKGGNVYKVMLLKLLAGSLDYQILCANCNWIKKVENKEHRYNNIIP